MIKCLWFFLFVTIIAQIIVCFMMIFEAHADTGLDFSNDVLYSGHHDRWYSNGVRIFHGPYAIGAEMYTPRDKRNPGIPVDDRPWDGYLYGEYTLQFEDERTVALRAGALGAASYQKELQKFVHNDLGLGIDPKGWDTQNASELALEVLYEHRFTHLFDSYLGWVRAETTYGARLGNVVDAIFLENDIRKGWFDEEKQFYLLAGIRGDLKAFDTHLQGRMFHDNTYTVDMIPFVASTWVGVGVEFHKWNIEIRYTYQTDETELQNYERHIFGTVTIKRIWN